MYDVNSINQLVNALQAQIDRFTQARENRRAMVYIDANESLKEWLGSNQTGPIPPQLESLTDFDWRSLLRPAQAKTTEPAGEQPAENVGDRTLQAEDHADAPDPAQMIALAKVRRLLDAGKLEEAGVELKQMAVEAREPAQRQQVASLQTDLLARRRRQLQDTEESAREYQQKSPEEYAGQRQRWQAVLRLDPTHQEAAREIARLDNLEGVQDIWRETRKIRSRLPEIRKRIDLLEQARSRVERMGSDSSIQNADILSEIERLYDDLSTFRNEILEASVGLSALVNSQNYGRALDILRNAVRAGYTDHRRLQR